MNKTPKNVTKTVPTIVCTNLVDEPTVSASIDALRSGVAAVQNEIYNRIHIIHMIHLFILLVSLLLAVSASFLYIPKYILFYIFGIQKLK
jgi:hypothetical protein